MRVNTLKKITTKKFSFQHLKPHFQLLHKTVLHFLRNMRCLDSFDKLTFKFYQSFHKYLRCLFRYFKASSKCSEILSRHIYFEHKPCQPYSSSSSFYSRIEPGTAIIPNIASAWFTLSIRTVSFPCSNSRTKRKPSPDLIANSSCVSPAFFLCFYIFSNSIHMI